MKDGPDFNVKYPEIEWVSYGQPVEFAEVLFIIVIILFITVVVFI